MGYLADQPILWPWLTDWSKSVSESLAFLTDVMQAPTGGAQVRALRNAPRRGFGFQQVMNADIRRIVDALRFDLGVQQCLLPIYADIQQLGADLAAGATSIPCRTDGFDFVAGGKAVLWNDVNAWELVTIASGGVGANALTLSAATVNAWPAGTRLYPVRKARVASIAKADWQSDDVSTVQVSLLIDEPCDWPAAWPSAATYRGVPVLEWRGDESTDPTDEFDRLDGRVDMDVGPVFYFDLPGMPFRAQSQLFTLATRADHTAFRSLLYMLNGRAGQVWVPSWQQDLRLSQPALATATQLQVPWCGYTQFGYLQANRRDIRIELYDGTILYRRITGSADAGDHEVLQIDSAPGIALAPGAIRQIGFLTMCALASDSVQLDHVTDADGVSQCTLNWVAVKSDV